MLLFCFTVADGAALQLYRMRVCLCMCVASSIVRDASRKKIAMLDEHFTPYKRAFKQTNEQKTFHYLRSGGWFRFVSPHTRFFAMKTTQNEALSSLHTVHFSSKSQSPCLVSRERGKKNNSI